MIDGDPSLKYHYKTKLLVSSAFKRVTETDSIKVGEVDGSQWVRVIGKGNFMSSPCLKEYVEQCLDEKFSDVIVDLEYCPCMDSTFMGTLAGLAVRLMGRGFSLSVVGLSERNRYSLVDLGLDEILQLEEQDGASRWNAQLTEIRQGLAKWQGKQNGAAAAEEVLDAHRKLCEVDNENHAKFGAVLDVLEKECSPQKTR